MQHCESVYLTFSLAESKSDKNRLHVVMLMVTNTNTCLGKHRVGRRPHQLNSGTYTVDLSAEVLHQPKQCEHRQEQARKYKLLVLCDRAEDHVLWFVNIDFSLFGVRIPGERFDEIASHEFILDLIFVVSILNVLLNKATAQTCLRFTLSGAIVKFFAHLINVVGVIGVVPISVVPIGILAVCVLLFVNIFEARKTKIAAIIRSVSVLHEMVREFGAQKLFHVHIFQRIVAVFIRKGSNQDLFTR